MIPPTIAYPRANLGSTAMVCSPHVVVVHVLMLLVFSILGV